MSAQPDFFADAPVARYPATPGFKASGPSQEAAQAMKPRASTIRQGVLACLAIEPMTPEQIAARLGVDILAVRPRLTELKLMGQAAKTQARGKSRGGLSSTVWELVKS